MEAWVWDWESILSFNRDISKLQRRCGIGLTGGTATGKSTVGKILKGLGHVVIDADKLSRLAVKEGSKGLAQIVSEFGGSILKESGKLNRKKLGQIIFNDPEMKQKLERIVHPIIHQLLAEKVEAHQLFEKNQYWFYEAALIFETGYAAKFNQVWVVHCPLSMQMKRIMKRDNVPLEHAQKILDSQIPNKQKTKQADVIIDTSTSLDELEAKIKVALEFLPKLQNMSSQSESAYS